MVIYKEMEEYEKVQELSQAYYNAWEGKLSSTPANMIIFCIYIVYSF